MHLALSLCLSIPPITGGDPTPGAFDYLRPDGTSYFKRPDGTSYYTRP